MIERLIQSIIEDLGATGLLVIGLYWLLWSPLRQIAASLKIINHELAQIAFSVKAEIEKEDKKD